MFPTIIHLGLSDDALSANKHFNNSPYTYVHTYSSFPWLLPRCLSTYLLPKNHFHSRTWHRKLVIFLVYRFWHLWMERVTSRYVVVWRGNCYILVTSRLCTVIFTTTLRRLLLERSGVGTRDRCGGPHESWVSYSKEFTNRAQSLGVTTTVFVEDYIRRLLCFLIMLDDRHLSFSFCFWSLLGGPLFVRSISKIRSYRAKRHFWLSLMYLCA